MGVAMPAWDGADFLHMDAAYQRNKTILITAFITMAVTSAVWLGVGGMGYWLMFRDSPEFELSVDHPETVLIGEVFKVKVTVKNGGAKDMKLADLDVYDDLLDGFEILSVNPKPRTSERIIGYFSHDFSETLAPAESFEIEFELRAKDVGYWSGDIDACTPSMNFVTYYTEIEVLDPTPVEASE